MSENKGEIVYSDVDFCKFTYTPDDANVERPYIKVTNNLNETLCIPLKNSASTGLLIKKIDGIDQGKATINMIATADPDKKRFNSASMNTRNIVIEFVLLDDFMTIEEARHICYQYFPVKRKVHLEFATQFRTATIDAYVESNEGDIFSEQETMKVSLLCEYPYFESGTTIGVTIDAETPEASTLYSGDGEIGLEIVTNFLDPVTHEFTVTKKDEGSITIDPSLLPEETATVPDPLASACCMFKINLTASGEASSYSDFTLNSTYVVEIPPVKEAISNIGYKPEYTTGGEYAKPFILTDPDTNVTSLYAAGIPTEFNDAGKATKFGIMRWDNYDGWVLISEIPAEFTEGMSDSQRTKVFQVVTPMEANDRYLHLFGNLNHYAFDIFGTKEWTIFNNTPSEVLTTNRVVGDGHEVFLVGGLAEGSTTTTSQLEKVYRWGGEDNDEWTDVTSSLGFMDYIRTNYPKASTEYCYYLDAFIAHGTGDDTIDGRLVIVVSTLFSLPSEQGGGYTNYNRIYSLCPPTVMGDEWVVITNSDKPISSSWASQYPIATYTGFSAFLLPYTHDGTTEIYTVVCGEDTLLYDRPYTENSRYFHIFKNGFNGYICYKGLPYYLQGNGRIVYDNVNGVTYMVGSERTYLDPGFNGVTNKQRFVSTDILRISTKEGQKYIKLDRLSNGKRVTYNAINTLRLDVPHTWFKIKNGNNIFTLESEDIDNIRCSFEYHELYMGV